MTELPQPLVVRRTASFAEAVYTGSTRVERIEAVLAEDREKAQQLLEKGKVPLLIDPRAAVVNQLKPLVLIDGVMAKKYRYSINDAPLVIGLGPGLTAGVDVHAVVETKRGHYLGRVLYEGQAIPDTGVPGLSNGLWDRKAFKSTG